MERPCCFLYRSLFCISPTQFHNVDYLDVCCWPCLDGNRAWICSQIERGSRHWFLCLHPCGHGPPHLHLLGKESQVPEKCIDPFPSFTFGSDLMLLYDAAQNSRGRCSHPNSQHGSSLFTRGHTLWRPTRCRSRILGQISSTKILLLSLSLICFLLKWFRFHSEWEVVSVPANGWRYQAAWVDHSLCQNALVSGKWEPVCSQSVRLSWGQASHPHVSFSFFFLFPLRTNFHQHVSCLNVTAFFPGTHSSEVFQITRNSTRLHSSTSQTTRGPLRWDPMRLPSLKISLSCFAGLPGTLQSLDVRYFRTRIGNPANISLGFCAVRSVSLLIFFFFSFFFSHLHEIGLAEFASTTRFRHLWKDPCCWRCLHLLPRLNLPPLSGCSWSRPRFSPPSQNSVVPQRHPKMVSVLSNWFTHLFPESSSSFLQRVLSMSLSTLKQRQRLTLSVRAFSFSFSGFWNQAESPRTLDLDIVCLAFSPSSTSVSTLAFWGFPRGLTATPRKRRKFPQSAWRSFTSFCFFWTSVRELCLKPSRIWFTGILGLKYSWGFSVEPAFYHRSDIYLFVCLGAPSQQSVYLYMQLLDIFKPENRTIDSLSKTGLRTFILFLL